MKPPFVLFLLFSFGLTSFAQNIITRSPRMKAGAGSQEADRVMASLDSLFTQIKQDRIDPMLINADDSGLSRSVFHSFLPSDSGTRMQIINCYPLSLRQYAVSIACQNMNSGIPVLQSLITVVAETNGGAVRFSTPLAYLTRDWKIKRVGNITYYYEGRFDEKVARVFERNNRMISDRLGLAPEAFRFYLTNNYQETVRLLGYDYDVAAIGKGRNGFFTGTNIIFSVMHNPDFSHDIFHYYSSKFRGNKERNAVVEEGLAYSWGNAYYTDAQGQMIDQQRLTAALVRYLGDHPSVSPWTLFNEKPRLFDDLAAEISVKSVISGVLCDEVLKEKGITGIKTLLCCGSGDANYLQAVNDLIGINQQNFDQRVRQLLNGPSRN